MSADGTQKLQYITAQEARKANANFNPFVSGDKILSHLTLLTLSGRKINTQLVMTTREQFVGLLFIFWYYVCLQQRATTNSW